MWEALYRTRTLELRELSETDSLLTELAARELTHANKLAALKCFLDDRHTIEMNDLIFGVRMARCSIVNTEKMVRPEKPTPFSWFDRHSTRVMEKVTTFGQPVSKANLARALGGNQTNYNKAISHLLTEGSLHRIDLSTRGFTVGVSKLRSTA